MSIGSKGTGGQHQTYVITDQDVSLHKILPPFKGHLLDVPAFSSHDFFNILLSYVAGYTGPMIASIQVKISFPQKSVISLFDQGDATVTELQLLEMVL